MRTIVNRLKRLNEALPLLILGIVLYAIIIESIGVWFVEDKIRYTSGLLIGCGCAIFLAINIAMVIEESVRIGEGHEKWLAFKSVLRYFVVVAVFFLMMGFKLGNLIPAILGVIGLKVSAYVQPLLYKFINSKDEEEMNSTE